MQTENRKGPFPRAAFIRKKTGELMNEYLTIQDFAQISNIEASTLRYWDEIGLFSPVRRDPENNYRRYSMTQLFALQFITTMRDLEIPLKTIAELREERDPEKLLALLEQQEHLMDMEMLRLRQRYSIIHARRELINLGSKIDESRVSIESMRERAMILWPSNEYRGGETFVTALAALIPVIGEYNINLSFPVGGYHENVGSFRDATQQPERFFTLDPVGRHRQKAGDYLVGYARGYYGEAGDLPDRMLAYAKKEGLALSGPVYSVYLYDEVCSGDPSDYLVQSSVAALRK